MERKLTSLLLATPIDRKKILKYGRFKKLDIEDLGNLVLSYIEISKDKDRTKLEITPFHVACSQSKPDLVAIFIEEGWNVNQKSNDLDSPLYFALDNGNIPVAHLLINSGADTISMNCHGFAPMAYALTPNKREKACVTAVKLLLNAGVQINEDIIKDTKEKPIHIAVVNNLPTVVSCLLQNGADANAKDVNDMTPLHTATVNNNLAVLKLLVLHGADFYIENEFGETPLLSAVKMNHGNLIEFLAKSGYDINRETRDHSLAPLHSAVGLRNLDLVKLLVSLGANPNKVLDRGISPLHILAGNFTITELEGIELGSYNRNQLAVYLIENGADVNMLSSTNNVSPLQVAVTSGLLGLAKLFLKMGADLNLKDEAPFPMFHSIVAFNRDIIVNFLEYGANYNVYNNMMTPYHFAISTKVDVQFIKSFVKHGCPYNQDIPIWKRLTVKCDHSTKCFFDAEIQFFKGIIENNLNLVKHAVKLGALVTSCSEEMKYPLHFLSFKGYKEMLTYLLEEQYPPNFLNEKGETALHIAAQKGDYNICRILLRYGACYNYYSKKFPKTPKMVARDFKHKDIETLLNKVERMFYLAKLKEMTVIRVLKKKLANDVDDFLMFVKVINIKGNTLLATALCHKNNEIAKHIMKMLLTCDI